MSNPKRSLGKSCLALLVLDRRINYNPPLYDWTNGSAPLKQQPPRVYDEPTPRVAPTGMYAECNFGF